MRTHRRQSFVVFLFRTLAAKVAQREVRGNPVGPCAEVSAGIKPPACPEDTPEGLKGQIFSNPGIADSPDNPGINAPLKFAEQCLKGIAITLRESLQQAHVLPLTYTTLQPPNMLTSLPIPPTP